jgi:hypothetical protein
VRAGSNPVSGLLPGFDQLAAAEWVTVRSEHVVRPPPDTARRPQCSIGSRSRLSLLQRWRDKSRRFATEQWLCFPKLRDRSELAAAFDDDAAKRFEDYLLTY